MKSRVLKRAQETYSVVLKKMATNSVAMTESYGMMEHLTHLKKNSSA